MPARAPKDRLRAAGSHWALSRAAVSDSVFVETHDPNNALPAMGRTLYDVVPGCLNDAFIEDLAARHPDPYDVEHSGETVGLYLVNFETGRRMYQAYSEMDLGDDTNQQSLAYLLHKQYRNSSYLGHLVALALNRDFNGILHWGNATRPLRPTSNAGSATARPRPAAGYELGGRR